MTALGRRGSRSGHSRLLTGVTCLPAGTCGAAGWYYYGATGPSTDPGHPVARPRVAGRTSPRRGQHSQPLR
jgi:hypothetical protein